MTANEHNKILAIGFAAFAVLFAFTFLLLMLVSVGVFVSLGITFANETADTRQTGIGILGGVFAILFYGLLGLVFVLPTAVASLKMFKKRRNTRIWGTLASLAVLLIMPLGTVLGAYALWFLFSGEGKLFYSRFDSQGEAGTL